MAYVVGLLGVTLGQALAKLGDWLLNPFRRVWYEIEAIHKWQSHARRARLEAKHRCAQAQEHLEEARGKPYENQRQAQLDKVNQTWAMHEDAAVLGGLWIRRTPTLRKGIGDGPTVGPWDFEQVVEAVLKDAWEKGATEELTRRNLDLDLRDASAGVWDLSEKLRYADMSDDPLHALRALDKQLYQEVDRERAERDFRIATMPPAAAISLLLVSIVGPWAYTITILAAITFLWAGSRRTREPVTILNQIAIKNLSLPSIVAAERSGRQAVRDYLVEREKKAATPAAKS